ncbi:MAG: hypothetical protein LBC20_13565 [Planctomycetaceae bacterium]|nr:hypothetical protein [Planctomycetaceae bacterium]
MPDEIDLGEMQQEMFQRQDGMYLFCEHVADIKTQKEIINTSKEWIGNFGCFALETLQKKYEQKIKNIANIDDFAVFVEELLFPFEECKTIDYQHIYLTRSTKISKDTALQKLADQIINIIDEKYSATDYEIIERIPALNSELLAVVVKKNIPNIMKTVNAETVCYQKFEGNLPDDLSEKIREAIDKLKSVNLPDNLESLYIVLSLEYNYNFLERYNLNWSEFKRIIAYYEEENYEDESYDEENISGEIDNKTDLSDHEPETDDFVYRPKKLKISKSVNTSHQYTPAPAFRRFYKTYGRLPTKEEYLKFKKENGKPFTPHGALVQFGYLKTWLNKNKPTDDW